MKKQFLLLVVGISVITFAAFGVASTIRTDFRTTLGALGVLSKPKAIETKEITLTGELQIILAEDLKNKNAWNEYWIKEISGNSVRVLGEALDELQLVAGSQVSIVGTMDGSSIRTSVSNVAIKSTGSQNNARTIKPQISKDGKRNYKVAVILFNFTDNPTQTYSAAYAKDVVYGNMPGVSVNDFYNDVSSGTFKLVGSTDPAGDVYGWYTLPVTQIDCFSNYASSWKSMANQAAQADGFDENAYDLVFYNFPTGTTNCSWSGAASQTSIPNTPLANKPWVFINGNWTPVYIHELGHILGLNHANSISCRDFSGNAVPLSTQCTSSDYGDPYDTMGGTDGLYFNARHKDYLGFPSGIKKVTTTGTYTLKSGNAPAISLNMPVSTDAYAIRIPLGTALSGSHTLAYYLESRAPSGWDSSIPVEAQTGISIRLGINQLPPPGLTTAQNEGSTSTLIDTHLATATFNDAPLQLGETYYDQDRNLKITYVSQSANGKMVKIEFMRGLINCTLNNPLLTVSPAIMTIIGGNSFSYQYTVVNRDTGTNCPPRVLASDIDSTTSGNTIPVFDIRTLLLLQNRTATGTISVATSPTTTYPTQGYIAQMADMFGVGANMFTLRVTSVSCVTTIPSVAAIPVSGSAGQSIPASFTVTNNNPTTCLSSRLRTSIINPYLATGWVVGPQAVFDEQLLGGEVGASLNVNITAPLNAPSGTYMFPISVEDMSYNTNHGNIGSLVVTIQ
jgi:M6 family metalloprotease-like protein